MKLSELIGQLLTLQEQHGNIDVVVFCDDESVMYDVASVYMCCHGRLDEATAHVVVVGIYDTI